MTGSREWSSEAQLHLALLKTVLGNGPTVFVHGDCPSGADHMTRLWVEDIEKRHPMVSQEPHPADWDAFGKRAGFRRNAEMVALGADVCLAFYEPGAKNNGTDHCAGLAEKAGIRVVRLPMDSRLVLLPLPGEAAMEAEYDRWVANGSLRSIPADGWHRP